MRDRLSKSILLTTGSYLLFQLALYAAFAAPKGFLLRYGPLFFVASLGFHLFLLAMLFKFKEDFVVEGKDERLVRVNVANRITLLRISTLPTILFLVIAAKDYRIRAPLLVLVILVFATDFADGYVSRKAGQVTRVGRMMDSASDYSLIIVLTIVFYYFHFIPLWLFIVIVGRLLIQALLVIVLVLAKGRMVPRTTFFGKAAVASIMILYTAEVLKLAASWQAGPLIKALEWVVGGVVAASVIDKVVAFFQDLDRLPEAPRIGEAGPDEAEPRL